VVAGAVAGAVTLPPKIHAVAARGVRARAPSHPPQSRGIPWKGKEYHSHNLTCAGPPPTRTEVGGRHLTKEHEAG
jgi:hypothetical protein